MTAQALRLPVAIDWASEPSPATSTGVDEATTTRAVASSMTWCWGSGAYGALGDGTRADRTSPAQVVGLPGTTREVATTQSHTCAVGVGGRVSCWGFNAYGKLGAGSMDDSLVPAPVKGFVA